MRIVMAIRGAVSARGLFAWAALASLALASTALAATETTDAGTTWTAQAGDLFPDESLAINQFLPGDITIVEGDTIVWERVMFHTVTLLSGGERPQWLRPLKDGRLGVEPKVGFQSGPRPVEEIEPIAIASWARDRLGLLEPSGELLINGNNEYDGEGFFNSGAPFSPDTLPRPVSVKFTKAGIYEVVCLIHPDMKATVTVLQPGFTAPDSQADLNVRAEEERASMIARAETLIAAQEAAAARRPDFTTAHSLKTGLFQDDVEYARFMPSDLVIRAGDTVAWDWVNAGDTPHTVTFLSGAEAPDYFLVEHKVFADGSLNVRDPPTIALNPDVFAASGGDTYSGSGVFSSGVLFGEKGPPGRPSRYSLRFDTPGTFDYMCLMHGPVMSGTITVNEAQIPEGSVAIRDDRASADAITYTLKNFPAPRGNTEYVGWLISDDGSAILNTGVMERDVGDGSIRHTFDSASPRYTGENLVTGYDRAVITEESAGADSDEPSGPEVVHAYIETQPMATYAIRLGPLPTPSPASMAQSPADTPVPQAPAPSNTPVSQVVSTPIPSIPTPEPPPDAAGGSTPTFIALAVAASVLLLIGSGVIAARWRQRKD